MIPLPEVAFQLTCILTIARSGRDAASDNEVQPSPSQASVSAQYDNVLTMSLVSLSPRAFPAVNTLYLCISSASSFAPCSNSCRRYNALQVSRFRLRLLRDIGSSLPTLVPCLAIQIMKRPVVHLEASSLSPCLFDLSAPLDNMGQMVGAWLPIAVQCNGVSPLRSLAYISAPASPRP